MTAIPAERKQPFEKTLLHLEEGAPRPCTRGIRRSGYGGSAPEEPVKRETSPRIGGESMSYLLKRVLLFAAPVLWRKVRKRRQKK